MTNPSCLKLSPSALRCVAQPRPASCTLPCSCPRPRWALPTAPLPTCASGAASRATAAAAAPRSRYVWQSSATSTLASPPWSECSPAQCWTTAAALRAQRCSSMATRRAQVRWQRSRQAGADRKAWLPGCPVWRGKEREEPQPAVLSRCPPTHPPAPPPAWVRLQAAPPPSASTTYASTRVATS